MEEERFLPKNIRQIADKDDRLRVYLEDYVYTYIHKMNEEERVHGGLLLGSRVTAEKSSCCFIRGAVEFEELISGGQIRFSEELWKEAEEKIREYFPDCGICGWFIAGGDGAFPDRQSLKDNHIRVFSGENGLMYWKDGQDDCFIMEEDGQCVFLKGYYVYYEKNEQMQNYLVNRREQDAECIDDRAAKDFRRIMEEKKLPDVGWSDIIRKAAMAAAAAAVFIGTAFAAGRIAGGKKPEEPRESVQALAVGASVERQSGIFDELPETYSESESERSSETEAAVKEEAESEAAEEETESESESESESDSGDNKDGILRSGMDFYNDGSGAMVYRITPTTEAESRDKESLAVIIPTEPVKETSEKNELTEAAAAVGIRPEIYTVQPNDTLMDISLKFYGSSDMVMQIKEANDLEDVNRIFIGQQLILP